MANNKKVRYIINTVLGAALLAGAVTAGVFLLRGGEDTPPTEQSTGDSHGTEGGITYEVVADNIEGDLQTRFEGPDHVPSMTSFSGTLTEAESGWYYYEQGVGVKYRDAATGESVVVCARPECTHDNEYCAANNSRYNGRPAVYYDGYLYGISGDAEKVDNEPEKNEEIVWFSGSGDVLLMRYAPDGTALDKLVSLTDALPDALDHHVSFGSAEIIGHKGALWISVEFERICVMVQDLGSGDYQRGYALFHYDLSAEKLSTVFYMPLAKDADPFAPTELRGIGDYVYFRKINCEWEDPLNGNRVYRVNIRTGAIEKVIGNDVFTTYAANGSKLLYLKEKVTADTSSVRMQLMLFDLHTGESRLFLGEEDYVTALQCTEDHVLVTMRGAWESIRMYDYDGRLLQTLPALDMTAFVPNDSSRTDIKVNGDALYGIVYGTVGGRRVYTMSLAAALEGSGQWQLVLEDRGEQLS